ncbi:MAG TPA: TatD family hydrolase [Anaerolineales bacterium]|nr:TatD family hydrolase [Anaerolineales bacterium]
MRLTDTHCHLYMDRFRADLPAVVARAQEAGVRRMLVPGLDIETSRQAIELAQAYEPIYCAIGFHPTETTALGDAQWRSLRQLLQAEKLAAIGEVGLDYYWVTDADARRQQRRALEQQLGMAEGACLPVVLHLREQEDADSGAAAQDLLSILSAWTSGFADQAASLRGRAGVLHSFSGTPETAAVAMDLGFYIGVTGPITFPTAEHRRGVVQSLPLARILIETDAPFLAPQQYRGKRNEPAYVPHIADRIAQIQSRTPTEVAEATWRNAARLFGWGEPD